MTPALTNLVTSCTWNAHLAQNSTSNWFSNDSMPTRQQTKRCRHFKVPSVVIGLKFTYPYIYRSYFYLKKFFKMSCKFVQSENIFILSSSFLVVISIICLVTCTIGLCMIAVYIAPCPWNMKPNAQLKVFAQGQFFFCFLFNHRLL